MCWFLIFLVSYFQPNSVSPTSNLWSNKGKWRKVDYWSLVENVKCIWCIHESGFWLQRGNALTGEAALQNTEKMPQNQTDKYNLHSEAWELIKYIFVSFFCFVFVYRIHFYACLCTGLLIHSSSPKIVHLFPPLPLSQQRRGRKAQLQKQ